MLNVYSYCENQFLWFFDPTESEPVPTISVANALFTRPMIKMKILQSPIKRHFFIRWKSFIYTELFNSGLFEVTKSSVKITGQLVEREGWGSTSSVKSDTDLPKACHRYISNGAVLPARCNDAQMGPTTRFNVIERVLRNNWLHGVKTKLAWYISTQFWVNTVPNADIKSTNTLKIYILIHEMLQINIHYYKENIRNNLTRDQKEVWWCYLHLQGFAAEELHGDTTDELRSKVWNTDLNGTNKKAQDRFSKILKNGCFDWKRVWSRELCHKLTHITTKFDLHSGASLYPWIRIFTTNIARRVARNLKWGGCFGGWKQHQTILTQILIGLHSK